MKAAPYAEYFFDVYESPMMGGGKEVFLSGYNKRTEQYYKGVLDFKEINKNEMREPIFTVTRRDLLNNNDPLYGLMDQLWNLGYRPKNVDEKFRDHEIEAIKYHLEDMRKLTFGHRKGKK